ncbi:MAG TPA: flavodoxin domain-containing protein [Caldilineaceae bacterium]|nr:flavodoxin domain-containing protein [Caldilineaceae bacterium]
MNRATRINITTIGVIFGLSGITHGCSEMLQGNRPTNGFFINAIAAGSPWTRWAEGGEGAFTLVPNFLITGMLAMLVGLAIMIWSLGFVHKPRGPLVYLLLFVLLFLVGGGIGQVPFFMAAWAVATRIHKPLLWWRRRLSPAPRRWLANAWPWLLVIAALLILTALVIAIWGYVPGIDNMARLLNITLAMVGASFLLFLLAYVAGFARDIEQAHATTAGATLAVGATPTLVERRTNAVLVAYATQAGSTQEVAEAVAARLREDGLTVDLQPMRAVQSVAGYRAVVLGAPLYMFRWHKDAKRFLARHRAGLAERPVAVFALGPFEDKAEDWQGVRAQLDKELTKFPWLTPADITIFGGKFDPAKLGFPYTLIPALRRIPVSDIRDWVVIRSWADALAAKFQPLLAP